jgi:hypothetical protein
VSFASAVSLFEITKFNRSGSTKNEYVRIKNASSKEINVKGWKIRNSSGKTYVFPSFKIKPGQKITLYSRKGKNKFSGKHKKLFWKSKNEISVSDKLLLRKELSKFFDRYEFKENCFSHVVSLGDRKKYLAAFDETIFARNPKPQDQQAEYNSGAIFINGDAATLLQGDTKNLQILLWHELTHAIEVENGDRRSLWAFWPRRATWRERNERHTEYLEAMQQLLDKLILFEKQVRNRELTPEQIKAKLAIFERDFKAGSNNEFQRIPKDLSKFSRYTGFNFDFGKVLEMYKKNECLKFPPGVFEGVVSEQGTTDRHVVWIATNATVGINIESEAVYKTKTIASGYSGGGLDPNHKIEKKLLTETRFNNEEEARKWICGQLTDFAYWPLGVGWKAKYKEKEELLGNTNCPQQK